MIPLSNGHVLERVIASGGLGLDGRGYLWEQPLIALGLIRPELFTIVLKTLTRRPTKGNLRWWKPWECVRPIPGGSVNKVGLTNPGIYAWEEKVAPKIDFEKQKIIGSIYGTQADLEHLALRFNHYNVVAVEINVSCLNVKHELDSVKAIVEGVEAVAKRSTHPLLVKVGVDQAPLTIARKLKGVVEAISLNAVSWETVFPDQTSPLHKLQKRVGGGGGGVSGSPAQKDNWALVKALADQGSLPVIAPSIMSYEDVLRVEELGASAVSFGAIHLPSYPVWAKPWTIFTNPCRPTRIVLRERANLAWKERKAGLSY